ncbi:MAG: hypothetical protein QGG63_01020 [Candidatus Pacebacteria bacterium]|jgi:preprotein translocase subunit SecG|nr:hypothetical protein [Candidatus Paceibacterota bacterium]|tara:strand:- start:24273 stop:24458 length:186 start_codon:yes stop_codon:yes gene_type:complete
MKGIITIVVIIAIAIVGFLMLRNNSADEADTVTATEEVEVVEAEEVVDAAVEDEAAEATEY